MSARPPFVNFKRPRSSLLPASRRKENCSRPSRASGWGHVKKSVGNFIYSMTPQNRNSWLNIKFLALLAGCALVPTLAQAHHLPGETNGFVGGLNHPVHGWDHILAMVA